MSDELPDDNTMGEAAMSDYYPHGLCDKCEEPNPNHEWTNYCPKCREEWNRQHEEIENHWQERTLCDTK